MQQHPNYLGGGQDSGMALVLLHVLYSNCNSA
jgi:hypothetical protein